MFYFTLAALIGLSEEQKEFYNLAKGFADKELAPYAGDLLYFTFSDFWV